MDLYLTPVSRSAILSSVMVKKLTNPEQVEAGPIALRVKDAATYLGCSTWAIRELVWDGKLRSFVVGRRLLIPRAELQRYLNERIR